MVKRCIAAGCSNTHKDGVSLFQFPRDHQLRQKWIKQVQRTRAGWSGPGSVAGSVLCSAHFEKSCFEPSCLISQSVGIKKKLLLKPDAVPTIFLKPTKTLPSTQAAAAATGTSKRRNTDTEVPGNEPKRARSAYEKRERLRVCFSYTS